MNFYLQLWETYSGVDYSGLFTVSTVRAVSMPSLFPFSYPTSLFSSYLTNFTPHLPGGINELDWLD